MPLLTENSAPDRHPPLQGRRTGAPSAQTPTAEPAGFPLAGPVPASRLAGFSDAKAEHLHRYFSDQTNLPQETPPMSPAADTRPSLAGGRGLERIDVPASETPSSTPERRRSGKQARRRRLHPAIPPAGEHNPGQPSVGAGVGDARHLGAITAHPVPSRSQRIRHLGIFNKGKAVASTSSGAAFSEGELLQRAGTRRAELGDRVPRQPPPPPPSHASLLQTVGNVLHALGSGRSIQSHSPRNASARRSSHGSHGSRGSLHSDEPAVDAVECARSWYSQGAIVEQGRGMRLHGMLPAPSSDPRDKVRRGSGAGSCSSSSSTIRQARLLRSIHEHLCDTEQLAVPVSHASASCSADNLNLSTYFDDIGGAECSTINIRGSSLTGMSGFNSSFFASYDQLRPRHFGDITVSDFGNSRHAMRPHDPITPTWPTHPADASSSSSSIDTLPKYVPRAEIPPPSYSGAPRASINGPPSAAPGLWNSRTSPSAYRPWSSQEFPGTYELRLAPSHSGAIDGRSLTDSREMLRFRHYPRRMW